MSSFLSAPIPFGEPCPVVSSTDTLRLLAGRRSASAQTLRAPGPDAEQLRELIRLAARVPDHGKLSPWRFVIIQGPSKAALVERLRARAPSQPEPGKAEATLAKLAIPPVTVMVVSRPAEAKIPRWEQELSAGAVCMVLLVAAQAMGFGANWITDWYAYAPEARPLLGLQEGEQVAGFIHLGTPAEPPLERVRPDLEALVTAL